MEENKKISKGKIIVVSAIVSIIILVGGLIFLRPFIHEQNREKDIINFLNCESTANIDEDSVKQLEFAGQVQNKWDCSEIIDDYIQKVIFVVKNTSDGNIKSWAYDDVNKTNTKGLTMIGLQQQVSYLYNAVEEKDVKMYREDKFVDYLVGELEKILIHEGDSIHSGWYIDGNSREVILPFDIRLTFQQKNIIARDVKEWKVAQIEEKPANGMWRVKLLYTDKSGKDQITDTFIDFRRDGWHKDDMFIQVIGLMYDMREPSIQLNTTREEDTFAEQINNHGEYFDEDPSKMSWEDWQ